MEPQLTQNKYLHLGSHSSPVSEGSHSPREALRVALVPLGMSQGLMILCELPARNTLFL